MSFWGHCRFLICEQPSFSESAGRVVFLYSNFQQYIKPPLDIENYCNGYCRFGVGVRRIDGIQVERLYFRGFWVCVIAAAAYRFHLHFI